MEKQSFLMLAAEMTESLEHSMPQFSDNRVLDDARQGHSFLSSLACKGQAELTLQVGMVF